MERRDLLINASDKAGLTAEEETKLRKSCDEGGIYLALTGSPGWKHLLENFINRRISQDRYLIAKTDELTDIRAAQRELFDLLQFISKKVENGQKAFEQLRAK